MPALHDVLVGLEHEGWEALAAGRGGDYYREHLTEDALMAFSFGVLSRAATLAAIEAAPPWESFQIEDAQVVELAADSGVVVYRVMARRAGDAQPYRAIVSRTFVRRDGTWKLAYHQQTPAAREPDVAA